MEDPKQQQSASNSVQVEDMEEGQHPHMLYKKLEVGVTVNSEEEAYDLYNQYALNKGFSVRKGNKRPSNGVIQHREYMCSKQGIRVGADPCDVKKINRMETRTDCKARIRFTVTNGIWKVTSFNDDHNHELADEDEKRNLRSGRKIIDAHANFIGSLVAAGIKPGQSYKALSKELGGVKNVGFTMKDCHNYLHSVRKEMIEAGDGQSVMNYFKRKQLEDPMFFYSVQVDEKNRMSNFFWRDGRSKIDYDSFGDVIIFDTTFRTNRYNLICAPFVGINHHWKNMLFGCAFLLDETTESFVWLFDTFLEAMGGQQPKCIFTDQDQAMANAIQQVFLDSRHRLCQWHLGNNAQKHLPGIYGNVDFKAKFHKCLTGCLDETEFQNTWDDMIQQFKLEDNKWLNRLYESREKWSTAYSVDIFSARMKSTQRSESMNNVFHQIFKTSLTLIQVIEHYDEKIEYMRQVERDDDFDCKNGSFAAAISHGGILGHAATIYTFRVYNMFHEEFLSGSGLNCHEVGIEGPYVCYEVQKHQGRRCLMVKFDKSNLSISCTCKLFESLGLLCRHSLRVLLVNSVNMIPAQYIMRRWTKDAKKRVNNFSTIDSSFEDEKSGRLLRLSKINHLSLIVNDQSSLSDEATRFHMAKLLEVLDFIEKGAGSKNVVEQSFKNVNVAATVEVQTDENQKVHDPPYVRKKGITNARIKSRLEKKRKRKGKCTDTQLEKNVNEQACTDVPPPTKDNYQLDVPIFSHAFHQDNSSNLLSMAPYPSFTRLLQDFSLPTPSNQDQNNGQDVNKLF